MRIRRITIAALVSSTVVNSRSKARADARASALLGLAHRTFRPVVSLGRGELDDDPLPLRRVRACVRHCTGPKFPATTTAKARTAAGRSSFDRLPSRRPPPSGPPSLAPVLAMCAAVFSEPAPSSGDGEASPDQTFRAAKARTMSRVGLVALLRRSWIFLSAVLDQGAVEVAQRAARRGLM